MSNDDFVRRSLTDLIKENEIVDLEREEVVEIKLELIESNPFQPRKHFDEDALDELAESIRMNGVLQPVIVKKADDSYILVAGERRCIASKLAGFTTVPAIVRDYNSQYLAELALLENIQREDLTIVEEAQAYQNVIQELSLTHLQLARKVGKSRSYISNTLGILSLPNEILDEINKGKLTMGHARALSKLSDVSRIKKISQMIIEFGLTVRDIEALAKTEEKKVKINRKSLNPNFQNGLNNTVEFMNSNMKFKSPVKISSNKIIITIHDEEELKEFKSKLGEE